LTKLFSARLSFRRVARARLFDERAHAQQNFVAAKSVMRAWNASLKMLGDVSDRMNDRSKHSRHFVVLAFVEV